MKWHHTSSKYILLVLLASNIACANDNVAKAEAVKSQVRIDNLIKEIDNIIGKAKCNDDSQCSYIDVGYKPCGGPAGYKIYSSKDTDIPLLFKKAKEHVMLSREFYIASGLISDCSVVMPPVVKCNTKCISE